MSFIEELRWRGMLHDMTPGIEEVIDQKQITGYIGFDPTAPSLTIGNYVQIMILTFFQKYGHRPIVLMGGATGRIGDPSGKDQERQLLSYDQLSENLQAQSEQMKKFLDFDSEKSGAKLIDNYDFYKDYMVLDFLREVGKTITVNYMLSKDSVKNRMDQGLSYTEFSYQILQAYDFQVLYQNHDCILQMGGSDQWGNITSGTEFIRRNLEEKAYAITTPLLTKADGTKFGKSTEGNIWLSPELTSPYQFYQFWINADDRDISTFFRYFSLRSKEEILSLEKEYAEDPRQLKKILAEELTIRIHSQADYEAVMKVSELLFNKKADRDFLSSLSEADLKSVSREIPSYSIDRSVLAHPNSLSESLVGEDKIFSSNGELRRAIKGNALSINKEKVTDDRDSISEDELLKNRYIMVENGKKNKYLLDFSS